MLGFITNERMDENGNPKPPERNKGIKWALISTVVVLAAAIFAASALSQIVMAGFAFASGVGIGLGISYLVGAVLSTGMTIQMCFVAKECILNAKYHLNPPLDLNGHRAEALN